MQTERTATTIPMPTSQHATYDLALEMTIRTMVSDKIVDAALTADAARSSSGGYGMQEIVEQALRLYTQHQAFENDAAAWFAANRERLGDAAARERVMMALAKTQPDYEAGRALLTMDAVPTEAAR